MYVPKNDFKMQKSHHKNQWAYGKIEAGAQHSKTSSEAHTTRQQPDKSGSTVLLHV